MPPKPKGKEASGMSKRSKMFRFVNCRIRARITEDRELHGIFMAFDRHMNMVMGDTEEFRTLRSKKKKSKEGRVERRHLGLVCLRGQTVQQLSMDGIQGTSVVNTERFPAAAAQSESLKIALAREAAAAAAAPGAGVPAGLGGPAVGVGAPHPEQMRPQQVAPPAAGAPGGGLRPATVPPPPVFRS
eukprot:TRINITY_DN60542_c0_g1_i1.p2 TRINITY_DN60542_c0_g1~~TRINITY_DN60542_c0_g1_i1.p2  ORF type:complete len:212 (+),score=75.16 TRINITY_DN60542_c0_g1_i1:81-638(+)